MTERTWKPRRKHKGVHETPFGRGRMLRMADGAYFYEAPRGPAPFTRGDFFGPWRTPEDEAFRQAQVLHERLEKAGWYANDKRSERGGWDVDELFRILAKLPADAKLGWPFGQSVDSYRLSKAFDPAKPLLRVGGIDVLDERHTDKPWDSSQKTARIAFKERGANVTDERSLRVELDTVSLDALIEFLSKRRETMISDDVFEGIPEDIAPLTPEGEPGHGASVRRRGIEIKARQAMRDRLHHIMTTCRYDDLVALLGFAEEICGDDNEAPTSVALHDGTATVQ